MKKKTYKHSPLIRMLGFFSTLFFLGTIVFIVVAGFNYAAGLLLIASIGGLAVPSVATGGGFIDTLSDMAEMVLEGIQTIVEGVVDFFSSILG